ncbi:MAG: ribonuclease P protein component [Legionellales bacterium RIFCSPHIGHO2_12_FULL_42_9]|nr:MAG: ribonuclease P protein component [Legionellales bacterium RIFCSPHIGHO2_12_FULL_42_9]
MYRFDESRRLRSKKDYGSVFKHANKTSTAELIILHQRTTLKTARLGLAISKKAIPKANQRNRIKRLLRESFRRQTLPPVDVVVLAKPGIAAKGNKVIFEKLSILWNKLAVIYEK